MANLDLSTYLESRVSYSRDGMNLSGHGYDARDFPTLCVLGINSWSAESVEIASVREKIANTLLTESQEQFK